MVITEVSIVKMPLAPRLPNALVEGVCFLAFLNLHPVVYIGGLLSTLLFVEGWNWQDSTVYCVCYKEERGREIKRREGVHYTDSENKYRFFLILHEFIVFFLSGLTPARVLTLLGVQTLTTNSTTMYAYTEYGTVSPYTPTSNTVNIIIGLFTARVNNLP
jgi:uncharacterized membrane protein